MTTPASTAHILCFFHDASSVSADQRDAFLDTIAKLVEFGSVPWTPDLGPCHFSVVMGSLGQEQTLPSPVPMVDANDAATLRKVAYRGWGGTFIKRTMTEVMNRVRETHEKIDQIVLFAGPHVEPIRPCFSDGTPWPLMTIIKPSLHQHLAGPNSGGTFARVFETDDIDKLIVEAVKAKLADAIPESETPHKLSIPRL